MPSFRFSPARFPFALLALSAFSLLVGCSGGTSNNSGGSNNTPNTITAVTASCTPTSVNTGGTSQCSANVTGTGSFAFTVTWSVGGVAGGNSTLGTINSAGLYTAPTVAPATNPVTITATSTQDTTKSGSASLTLIAPTITAVTATCTPTSAVTTGASQCSANVTGTGNFASTVTWSAGGIYGGNSTAGTITSAGLYTAPATVPATNPVTITAISTQDTTKSGSASVTITAPTITAVTATCTPTSVVTAATSQCSANVTGTGNFASTVTWSVGGVAGGNSTLGTITSAGLYTAPSAIPATNPVTITATSTANTAKSGSASLTITAPPTITAVTASCTPTSVVTTGTSQCSANVTGTGSFASTVTWSVGGIAGGNSTLGTINSSGLYTAPATVPATNPVTITATSTANTAKSGTASITITAPTITAVTASCTPTSVAIGSTSQCSANVTGTGNFTSTVTWSVGGIAGGNSAVGTITSAGLYTAPAAIPATNPVTITAVSTANTAKSGTASITVTAAAPAPTVTLSATALAFGNQATSAYNQPQTLLLSNTGNAALTINSLVFSGTNSADFLQYNNCPLSNGVLSAGASCYINVVLVPSASAAEAATLTITSNASNGVQKVSLTGTGVSQLITVGPANPTVEVNQTVLFGDYVYGLTNTAVNWTASAGSITSSGVFTAPATVPTSKTVTITATSQANAQVVGTTTVTIIPVTVSVLVSPAYASLATGGSEVLTASVVDTTNGAVTWTVNGIANGNASVGTITTIGTGAVTYTAPASLPATNPVTITATSAADTTKSSSAVITIAATSAITLTSIDKTSLAPYNLLTITGTGFNPQASPRVTFSDSTGFSVTETPVDIGANTLSVGVPVYISVATNDLAAGTVNIQVSQTIGTAAQTSNTLAGLQIPNLPTVTGTAGALTLAQLNTHNQFVQYVSSYLTANSSSPLNTPEVAGSLAATSSVVSNLIAQVSDVVQNPTHSFPLATISGNTLNVTTTELARSDRLIAGLNAAHAGTGYGDPMGECESYEALFGTTVIDPNALLNGANTNTDLTKIQCFAPVSKTAVTIAGGSAAVGIGGGSLIFGAEGFGAASAATSIQLATINSLLDSGTIAIGNLLGPTSAAGKQLVQGGLDNLNDYATDVLKSTFITTTFGEVKGTLYDLATNVNEMLHATFSAPPFSDGPATGPTYTLTISLNGSGSGTLVSYPGGIVCTNTLPTVCTGTFPAGTAVYLEFQSDTGSTFSGFSGACSGTSCSVTMSGNQSVGVSFSPSSTVTYPAGAYNFTCTDVAPSVTCCVGGSCSTVPGFQTSGTDTINLTSGTSLSTFVTQVCSQVSIASSSCYASTPCAVTSATSTAASFTSSCTAAPVSGCTTATTTQTCTVTVP